MFSFNQPSGIVDELGDKNLQESSIKPLPKNVFKKRSEKGTFLEDDSLESFFNNRILLPLETLLKRGVYFVQYNLKEISKRRLQYLLGLGAVVLVVIAVSATISATGQLPIVFLRVSEMERGQHDIFIQSSGRYSTSLNYSQFKDNLKRGCETEELYEERYSLHSPRMIGRKLVVYDGGMCQFENGTDTPLKQSAASEEDVFRISGETNWMYGLGVPPCVVNAEREDGGYEDCVELHCGRRFVATLVAADSKREKRMGFGRTWEHKAPGVGKCYISSHLASALNVDVGSTLLVPFDSQSILTGPFREVGIVFDSNSTERDSPSNYHFRVVIPLEVELVFDDKEGKFDEHEDGDEIIYTEYSAMMEHMARYVHPEYNGYKSELKNVNLYDYAHYIYINAPNRIQEYNDGDYFVIMKRIAGFAGEITYMAGFDQVEAEYPLLDYLEFLSLIAMFLNLIIQIIIIILIALSILLIYSLLMINVEDRTFEMGVLRMIGLQLSGLMQMIFQQALLYSLPGIVIGIVFGQVVYLIAIIFLSTIFEVKLPWFLSWNATLIAIPIGFMIPLLGAIVPIRNALKKNLHESLDTRRSKVKAVKVKITRSSEGNISWSLLIFAVGVFGFGFFIYYFFPLALLTMKISLLLSIFFSIIVMMNVGCVILALNLETILHKIITHVILVFENVAVRNLVLKNLIAHKERNRKTTIMYGVSLGFLIFIAVATKLEIRQFKYMDYKQYGTELRLYCDNWWQAELNNPDFRLAFDTLVDEEDGIVDYAYKTFPSSHITPYEMLESRTIGYYESDDIDVSGISPNFFDVVDEKFLEVNRRLHDGLTLGHSLYTVRGSYQVLLGMNIWDDYSFPSNHLHDNFVIQWAKETEMFTRFDYFLVRAFAVMEGAAASSFSKYGSDFMDGGAGNDINGNDVFVSMTMFRRMLSGLKEQPKKGRAFHSIDKIPLQYIYLKLNKDIKIDKEDLKEKIKMTYTGLSSVYLEDVEDSFETISLVEQSMNVFFYLSTAIAMTLCFFSLISNMYTNIQQQSKEIGIIRSMGMRKFNVKRVYVYEALIVIYAAAAIGILTGTLIGYTLILQQELFTQLGLGFIFPWEITLIVLGSGIIFGFLASIFPIELLLRQQVVTIFRKH